MSSNGEHHDPKNNYTTPEAPEGVTQDIEVAASAPIDKTASVTVDEARQYHPLCLDDLYPELGSGSEDREHKVRQLVQRFWSKVERRGENECWPWVGTTTGNGYGLLAYRDYRNFLAHRLAFILEYGSIPEGASVLHDCGNKFCTNPLHLKAGGDSENMLDAVRHGAHAYRIKLSAAEWDQIRERHARGETYRQLAEAFRVSTTTIGNVMSGQRKRPKGMVGAHPTALLTEEQVLEARRRVREGESTEALAKEFGVSRSLLHNAVYGRTWRHLPKALPLPGKPYGEANSSSKLAEGQVREIRRRVAAGESRGAVARELGLSVSTVSRIVSRKQWAWVTDNEEVD